MAGNLGSIEARMVLDIAQFLGNMDKASQEMQKTANNTNSKLQNFGSKMTSAGNTLFKSVTMPVVGFAVASAKMAMDTDVALRKVNSIAQLSGKEWNKYVNEMKQGATDTGMAYSEYAEATYEAISAGVKYTDTTKFLDKANKLAKGGFTDLTKATDVLTTIQNAYGMSIEDTTRISDILIQTQNVGKTTVDELAGAMGRVIPTAQAQGVSIEQLGASYAIMTAKGINTAEATTYINSMFNELGKSGTDVDEILREISGKSFKGLMEEGKSVGDVLGMLDKYAKDNGKSLSDLFGSAEAGKAGLSLLGNGADEFNKQLQGMNESTGATNRAFEAMKSPASKCKEALNNMKNAMSDLGESMLPVIADSAEMASKFFTWASEMIKAHPWIGKVAFALGALLAVIGPVLIIIGSMITAVGKIIFVFGKLKVVFGIVATFIKTEVAGAFIALWVAMMTTPIGWIITAIGLLIGGLVLLYNKCDWFKDAWNKAWNKIKEWCGQAIDWIGDKFEEFKQWLTELPDKVRDFVDRSVAFIKSLPERFWRWLLMTINKIITWKDLMVQKAIELGTQFITNTITWLQELPGRVWDWLVLTVARVTTWVSDMATKAIDAGTQFVTNFIIWLAELPFRVWEWLMNTIAQVALWGDQMIDKAISIASNFIGQFIAWLILLPVRLWELLTQALIATGQWGIDMWNKAIECGSNFLNTIITWFQQLPDRIWEWLTNTYNKVVEWATNMWNKASETASNFVNKIIDWVSQLPGKFWTWLTGTYNKVVAWAIMMWNKAREAGQQFVNKVINFIAQLPGKVWTWLKNVIEKAKQWAKDFARKGKEGAEDMARKVVNGIKSLPGKVATIGSDIVHGLWNGISGAGGWLYGKVKSFATGVLDSMKSALGINSPSREARDEVGRWLPPGIGAGIDKAKPKLFKQATDMARGLLSRLSVGDLSNSINYTGMIRAMNAPSLATAGVTTNTTNVDRSLNVYIQNFTNNTKEDLPELMERMYSYDKERKKVRGEIK